MKGADGLLGPQGCSYWENSSPLRYCCCGLVCQRARGKSQPGSEDTHTHIQTHTEWEDGEGKKTE